MPVRNLHWGCHSLQFFINLGIFSTSCALCCTLGLAWWRKSRCGAMDLLCFLKCRVGYNPYNLGCPYIGIILLLRAGSPLAVNLLDKNSLLTYLPSKSIFIVFIYQFIARNERMILFWGLGPVESFPLGSIGLLIIFFLFFLFFLIPFFLSFLSTETKSSSINISYPCCKNQPIHQNK